MTTPPWCREKVMVYYLLCHCLLCWAALNLGNTHTNIKHAEYGAWPPLQAKVGGASQKVGGAMQNVGGAQQDAHSLVGGQAPSMNPLTRTGTYGTERAP